MTQRYKVEKDDYCEVLHFDSQNGLRQQSKKFKAFISGAGTGTEQVKRTGK